MTWSRGERLYHRLPEVYRRRDREQGEPLRALLAVVESQLEALEDDIAGLYENWFLETCQDWVVPYLADLLGVQVLGDPAYAGAQPRAQVARVLDYRQHKGTPAVLERVSRDIVGWPARVVEMFELLAHTQNVGHVRPGRGGVLDVRRPEDVAAAGDPFAPPTLFHSVDVRRIASGRGRFNVPDLALHLWRLRSYFLASSPAAPAPETPAGFRFDPLGRDLPLFNRLAPATGSTRQAAETDLPVPLRVTALDRDLQAYRRQFAAVSASLRAPASGFYGPGRALLVTNGPSGPAFAPVDVVARNLDTWGAVGRFSGTFAAAPSLTAAQGELRVTLGDEGPHVARLSARPADLAGAARLLEAALRGADPSPRFANARVFVAGSRLYVVSGEPGDRVAFDATDDDSTTVGELHLTSAASAPAPAALSGVLVPFPAIPEAAPPLQTGKVALVVVHGSTHALVALPAAPRDLEQAQQELAAALQSTTVHVFTAGGRLLLVDEDPAAPVSVQPSTGAGAVDPLTALLLDLTFAVAIDPERGRLLFAPGVTPAAAGVRVGYAYGSAADLGGGPYDRRSTLTDPATVDATFTVAKAGPAPALSTLAAAIDQWAAGGRKNAVIQVTDDELYAESLPAIAVPAGSRLAIEAADGTRPLIRPLNTLSVAGPGAVTLNGLLLDGGIELGAGLDLLLTHSTLVPRPGQGSLTFKDGDDPADLRVRVTSSIVGALRLPADLAALELADSILDASEAGTGGEPLPALVSGPLPGTLALSAHLEVGVKLGSQGPVSARLRQAPTTLAAARDALQAAILAAGTGTSFSGAQVEVVGSRLLVRSGAASAPPEPVAFSTTTADATTAGALQLLPPAAENLAGRLSGDLSVFPALRRPQVGVTIGGDGPWIAVLNRLPADLDDAASRLQAAIRAARDRPAFTAASVASLGDHLLVRPGVAAALVDVADTAADTYTEADLGFAEPFTPPEGTFVQGVFSAPLSPFPSFPGPQLQATLGGGTASLNLIGAATTLADVAATLGTVLRAASADPAFALASVVALGDRLLVRPGTPGAAVSFAGTSQDPRTLGELALAAPPAEAVDGLLSGSLASFPSFLQPQLQVTLGGEGPHLVVLAGIPRDVGSARELLQAALRAASATDVFGNAEVLQLGARLLVRSGGAGVVVQTAAADANTAGDLGLTVPPARPLQGLLSGPIQPFPTFPVAQLKLSFGGAAAQTATLAAFPATSQDARSQLEAAIQAAGPTPSYTGARVGLFQDKDSHDRLLVISGAAGETVRADVAADDPLTVADLGLAAPGAVLVSGLLSGELFPFPILFQPQIAVTFGALGPLTAVLATVPANLVEAATLLTAALKAASTNPRFANASVLVGGDRLLILPGTGGQPATFATTAADANTAESLALVQPPARSVQGLLSGDLATFPVFARARLQIAIGASGPLPAELTSFPANLTEAAAALQSAIRSASPTDSAFATATVTADNGRLLIQPGTSSSGPVTVTAAPAPDSATAGDLALLQPLATPVLISGDLAAFPALPLPEVAVTLGTHGPVTVTLDDLPASLDDARSRLEAAIQRADSSSTFRNARVVKTSDDRLLVLPGVATDAVAIANFRTDQTATELKLAMGPGNGSNGLFSGSLATFPALISPVKVDTTFGTTTRTATLSGVPTDLATARSLLEMALQTTIPAATTFTVARVQVVGSQLLVLPGVETDAVSFFPSTGSTAATDLELTAAAGASQALLSGTLNLLPALTAAPAATVTLAGNSRLAILTSVPKTLTAAAAALQTAIHAADPSAALFTGATVEVLGTRLLVRPGGTGGSVQVTDAGSGRPTTATALLLKTGNASTALLSGDLSTFGGLSITLQVKVTIGATGPSTLRLTGVPSTLDDARDLLQSALQSGTGAAFTGATVELFGTRLLVVPGAPGGVVTFADAPAGPPVATLLALTGAATSVDGLLSGSIAPPLKIPLPPLALAATIAAVAHTVDLGQVPGQTGQVPANLADLAAKLQALLRAAGSGDSRDSFKQAQVLVMGNQILVLSGVAGERVGFTSAPASPQVVATLKLDASAARTTQGLLSTALSSPLVLHIAPSLNATFGSDGPHAVRFTAAPKGPQSAADLLQIALQAAATTSTFANAEVQALGNRLLVTPGTATDAVTFAEGSSGPPTVSMLGLSPSVATAATGLLSGPLPVVPLEAASPEVQATLGGTTATARFTTVPVDLAAVRSGLESALRNASSAATFTGARVDVVDGVSLLVRPGVATDAVAVAGTANDPDTAGQLRLTAGRARSARGLLSGSLKPLPTLTPGGSGPRVDVTLGTEGPRTATLAGVPASLGEARDFLETAIQRAQTTPAFTGARVLLVGDDRLLVLPGTAGVAVTIADVSGGPSTATELKLTTAMGAATTEGLLSGDGFVTPALRLEATLAGQTGHLTLGAVPTDLDSARNLLEKALQKAASDPTLGAFRDATVRALGDRLLVRPGGPGPARLSFSDAPFGPAAATLLGLAPGERGDGLLSGPLPGFAGLTIARPAVEVTFGNQGPYTAQLTRVPADLADLRGLLQSALRASATAATFTGAQVQTVGQRLLITPGRPTDSVSFAPAPDRPQDLQHLGLAPLVPAGGLLSAALPSTLTLPSRSRLSVQLGSGAPQVIVLAHPPADLADAASVLQQALRAVPPAAGTAFQNATVRVVAASRLLVGAPGVTGDQIVIGPVLATPADPDTAFRLRLDRDSSLRADGLLSGDLPVLPPFASRPIVDVTIGDEAAFPAELPYVPANPAEARDALESALHAARSSPAFALARVALSDDQRLIILPGRAGRVTVAADPSDPKTAGELKLTDALAAHVGGLLSGPLAATVSLSSPAPELRVIFSTGDSVVVSLGTARKLTDVRAALQAALAGKAYVVLARGNRLAIVPAADGVFVGVSATAGDATTAGELGLTVGRAVGTGTTDEDAGPPLSLTRATVFGRVIVRELPLASEVIFNAPVRVERRQVGCLRFSYVPASSEVPRGFRCQPDLALAQAMSRAVEDHARELGLTSADELPAAVADALMASARTAVLTRLQPRFTSERYGDPGYGQLALANAPEILTGAENGLEMGAFHQLLEPLRRRQLATLIAEYLRFGLDAGIFDET